MSLTSTQKWVVCITLALAFGVGTVLGTLLFPLPRPPIGSQSVTNFSQLALRSDGSPNLSVDQTGSGNLALFKVAATPVITIDRYGSLTTTQSIYLTAGQIVLSSESITPTDGNMFTPTKALVTLTPAITVGVSLGSCTTGQQFAFYDSAAFTVTITDTGNFVGAGNQSLGQYDTLRTVCIGSKHVQDGPVSSN